MTTSSTSPDVEWSLPSKEQLKRAYDEFEQKFGADTESINSHLFWRTYGTEDGWFGKKRPRNVWSRDSKGNLIRLKARMRRREWIESHVMIRDKRGKLVPMVYNPAQRRLEAWVLRMERAQIPVRIVALKCRQIGWSTYSEAFALYMCLHEAYMSALIVADTQERAKMLLQIAHIAREHIPRFDDDKESWEFKMKAEARYSIAWAAPMNSEIQITSSESGSAGRGGTRRFVQMDEKAFWTDAQEVMAALGPSLPSMPGTYGFSISTANGDYGLFRDEFMAAWKLRHIKFADRLKSIETAAIAIFFAWFENPEYRWTVQFNQKRLPDELAAEIEKSLDEEERWLLEQRYFQRGVGWKQVDLDQIAWWRAALHGDVCHGDRNMRRQEYAYSPETCFVSSGRRVFDPEILGKYAREVTQPQSRGSLVQGEAGERSFVFKSDYHGGLHIWKEPVQGRSYVIGADAAGGAEKSDFAAAVVIEAETCEVVAIYQVRMPSVPWGETCARLGWKYNEAMLAFETFPSAFGLAAAHAAVQLGYQEIFTRHRENVATMDQTDLLGFHTNVSTKPLLISRIQETLAARSPIPAGILIDELVAQSYDPETGKMVCKGHDDVLMSFGIALYVRDLCWTQGLLRPEPERARTESDDFWNRRSRFLGSQPKNKGRKWIA